jgi:hypothetical protein
VVLRDRRVRDHAAEPVERALDAVVRRGALDAAHLAVVSTARRSKNVDEILSVDDDAPVGVGDAARRSRFVRSTTRAFFARRASRRASSASISRPVRARAGSEEETRNRSRHGQHLL